eukprot:12945456-Alexandrium_andersonii.AAC.1
MGLTVLCIWICGCAWGETTIGDPDAIGVGVPGAIGVGVEDAEPEPCMICCWVLAASGCAPRKMLTGAWLLPPL